MNPIKLARVAAEAETLRLRAMMSRMIQRAVFAAIAIVFLLAVLVFVHILAWHALDVSAGMSFYAATCIVGGADLLLALILLAMAARSSPSRLEREALDVRRNAVVQMRRVATLSQLVWPAVRTVSSLRSRRR